MSPRSSGPPDNDGRAPVTTPRPAHTIRATAAKRLLFADDGNARIRMIIAPLAEAAGRCVQTLANHASISAILTPMLGAEYRPRECFNANGDPKVRHKSREHAIQHKRSLILSGRASAALQVYQCGVCGYWHVGNRRRGGRR